MLILVFDKATIDSEKKDSTFFNKYFGTGKLYVKIMRGIKIR